MSRFPTPTPTPSPAPTSFTSNELVVYSQQPVLGIPKNLRIDRTQAEKQLTLLGLLPDQVHVTAFFPKGDPRRKGDKGRKTSSLDYTQLEEWQAEGRGIYFVVNGGGHTLDKIKLCLAIFCEDDNLSKDLQLELWKRLGLPEPTLQIDTGGRSIHNYWMLKAPIEPDLWAKKIPDGWEGIQWDLLEYTNADQSLTNRNRVMRLAGAWYMAHTEEKGTHAVAQSKIVGGCGKTYTYAELRQLIPLTKGSKPKSDLLPSQPGISSFGGGFGESTRLDFRSVGHRLPEWNDIGRPGWATFQCPVHTRDGASHANDHIHVNLSTGKWYVHCECKRPEVYKTVCELVGWNPSSKGKGYDRGANKTNGCGNGSVPPTGGGNGSGGNGSVPPTGGGNSSGGNGDGGNGDEPPNGGGGDGSFLPHEEIIQKIDTLITQDTSGSTLTAELNYLAREGALHVMEIRKLHAERVHELTRDSERNDNKRDLASLLTLFNKQLELINYLPSDLADPLTRWCEWLNIQPSVVLTALLVGTSSLHKVGTEIVLHRNLNFRVPPTIYAALVANSGQMKSPVFSNILRQPLGELRKAKQEIHKGLMQEYEAKMAALEGSKGGKNKEDEPEKPKDPTLYYFTNATGEAIPAQAAKDPDKSLLGLVDELSGLFNSSNAYRSGRGSDKQDLLSYFEGFGQTILRASGVTCDVEKIYLSVFGTIQPEILSRHMDDCSDPDGQWARFLFVNQPLAVAYLPDDDGLAVSIRDRIADYYRKIERVPEMEYRLSREAFQRYQVYHDQLERERVKASKPGLSAVYSKMKGYIGRLAINLHVLWEISKGKTCPDAEIGIVILEKAVELARFYVSQLKVVHASCNDNGDLAPHIAKLIDLSKRLDEYGGDGWIKTKQVTESYPKKKRPTAETVREWMSEAVSLGYGQTRGIGNRMQYHWNSLDNPPGSSEHPSGSGSPNPTLSTKKMGDLENLGNYGEHLGNTLPHAVSPENQGVGDNSGNLGKGMSSSSPCISLTEMECPKQVEMLTTDIKSNGYLPTEMVCPKKEVQKFTERDGGDRQILSEGTLPQVPQGMQKTPPSNTSDLGNTLPQVSPNPSPSSPNVPKVSSPPEAVESKACGSFPQENPSSAGTNAAGGSNVEGKTEWVWPKSLNIGDKCKYFGADQPNLKGGDLLEVINLPPSDRDAVEVLLLPDRTMTFSVKRGDLLVEGES